MSLIQRQQKTVDEIESIYRTHFAMGHVAFSGATVGKTSKAMRLHREEMVKAGYTAEQARESAIQCKDVAYMNASAESFYSQMGA